MMGVFIYCYYIYGLRKKYHNIKKRLEISVFYTEVHSSILISNGVNYVWYSVIFHLNDTDLENSISNFISTNV